MKPQEMAERLGAGHLKPGEDCMVLSPLPRDGGVLETTASFHVTRKEDGSYSFHDFGDGEEDETIFYHNVEEALLDRENGTGDAADVAPMNGGKEKKKKRPRPETIASYAKYLNVPESFLRKQGLRDTPRGVAMPLTDEVRKIRKGNNADGGKFAWDPVGVVEDAFPLLPVPGPGLPETIMLCEGESDYLIGRFLGHEAFALTKGAKGEKQLTRKRFRQLKAWGVTQVIFVPHLDLSGQRCMRKLAQRAVDVGIEAVILDLSPAVPEDANLFTMALSDLKDLHEWYLLQGSRPTARNLLPSICSPFVPDKTGVTSVTAFQEAHSGPVHWVIPELVAVGDIIGIVAPPKNLKTYFILHLMYCLTAKQPLFNQGRYLAEEQIRVLLVEEEGNADLFATTRLARLARTYGSPWNEKAFVQFKEGFTLEDDAAVEELIEEITENQIQVLILDPWQRMTGDRDESSSSETQKLWTTVLKIQRAIPGLTIFIVHHARKDAELNQNMVRGSSRFMGEVDTVFLLRKEEDGTMLAAIEGRDHEGTDPGQAKKVRVTWKSENHEDIFFLDGTEFTENVSIQMQKGTKEDSPIPGAIDRCLTDEWQTTQEMVTAINDDLDKAYSRQAIAEYLPGPTGEQQKMLRDGRKTNCYRRRQVPEDA